MAYGYRHTRFLVYISFFSTAAWSRFPSLLRFYADDLLAFCIFLADSTTEVDLIEEKMRAFQLAHLIHNFSETSTPTTNGQVIATSQLRRAESLIRCASLHFLECLPRIFASLPADSHERTTLEAFLVDFAQKIVQNRHMQSEKGTMAGEGNSGANIEIKHASTDVSPCPLHFLFLTGRPCLSPFLSCRVRSQVLPVADALHLSAAAPRVRTTASDAAPDTARARVELLPQADHVRGQDSRRMEQGMNDVRH